MHLDRKNVTKDSRDCFKGFTLTYLYYVHINAAKHLILSLLLLLYYNSITYIVPIYVLSAIDCNARHAKVQNDVYPAVYYIVPIVYILIDYFTRETIK